MIVARFKIHCAPEHADEMRRVLQKVIAPSRQLPGVLHFDVARDLADDNAFIATEVFEDRAALKRQNAQPEVAALMKLINAGVLTAPPEWSLYEVASAESPPI